jgi:hypothetical protein
MASLTITRANVKADAGAVIERRYLSGSAAIQAGHALYFDVATDTWKYSDSNASVEAAASRGVALHAAAAGQPVAVQVAGDIVIGATLVPGEVYVAGAAQATINPHSDAGAGWYATIVGVAISTTVLRLGFHASGGVRA